MTVNDKFKEMLIQDDRARQFHQRIAAAKQLTAGVPDVLIALYGYTFLGELKFDVGYHRIYGRNRKAYKAIASAVNFAGWSLWQAIVHNGVVMVMVEPNGVTPVCEAMREANRDR